MNLGGDSGLATFNRQSEEGIFEHTKIILFV
jgi:hypothetical protein